MAPDAIGILLIKQAGKLTDWVNEWNVVVMQNKHAFLNDGSDS